MRVVRKTVEDLAPTNREELALWTRRVAKQLEHAVGGGSQQHGKPAQFLAALASAALVEPGCTAKQLESAVRRCSQQPGQPA